MSYYPPQQPQDGDQSRFGWPQQQPSMYYPSPQPSQQQNTGYPQWQQPQYPIQPNYPQQEPQQYPQQPYYPPQQYPPPPKKKSRKTLWIVLGIIVGVLLFSCIGFSAMASQIPQQQQTSTQQTAVTQAAQQPTSQPTQAVTPTPTPIPPTPTPIHTPRWVTTQTINGSGNKKTAIFTVPGDWKILWSCNPASDFIGEYNLSVSVYNSDGTPFDYAAINEICKTGNTSNSTEEHQGGQVYLDIEADGGTWTVQVQELQ